LLLSALAMQQLGQLHLRAPHQQSPQTIPSDDRSFGDGIILAFGNRNSDRRPYRECTIHAPYTHRTRTVHAPYTHRTRTVHAPYVNDPITLFLLNLQLEIIKNQVRTIYLHNVTGAGCRICAYLSRHPTSADHAGGSSPLGVTMSPRRAPISFAPLPEHSVSLSRLLPIPNMLLLSACQQDDSNRHGAVPDEDKEQD